MTQVELRASLECGGLAPLWSATESPSYSR